MPTRTDPSIQAVLSALAPAGILGSHSIVGPVSCFQDGQHLGGPAEKAHSAVIGGNMLVVARPGSEKVAQLVVSAAEPSC